MCADVCGTIGTEFLDYYLDELELLHKFDCDPTSDAEAQFLLGDAAGDKYLFINLYNKEEVGTFTMGVADGNGQVDFTATGGGKESYGTFAEVSRTDPTERYGKGTGEIFRWDTQEEGGQVQGVITITEAWAKKDGFLANNNVQKGSVRIRFQGKCSY
jgi:hypothetical protein